MDSGTTLVDDFSGKPSSTKSLLQLHPKTAWTSRPGLRGLGAAVASVPPWPPFVRYMGEWKNDQKNGAARVVYGNGDRFEGSFKDGKRTGLGTVAWPPTTNGSTWHGHGSSSR